MDGALLSSTSVPAAAQARALRLLVTAHFVFRGRVGGAEHMLYNLVHGLAANGAELGVLCADPANLDPAFVAELRSLPGAALHAGGGTGRPRFVAEQRSCLQPGLQADAVLFSNYFVPPVVPKRLGRVASVLHDMQFRHFPNYFSAKKRAWLAASQAWAVRRSDTVIAISDFVRQDILRQYGPRLGRKVVTVPNPISWDRFAPAAASAPPMAHPYVLAVAAQYAHKNLEVLVRAFAELAGREPGLQLVFCGQDYNQLRGVAGQRLGLTALAESLGVGGRVHMTGYVDDAALGVWYRHATVFAFPSIFEGFGMPPVEALGLGLPVLTTRRTALPEVTLGLAEFVEDPHSAGEWADRLGEMVRNPGAHRPSQAAVAHLRAHYSPARIGAEYLRVCEG